MVGHMATGVLLPDSGSSGTKDDDTDDNDDEDKDKDEGRLWQTFTTIPIPQYCTIEPIGSSLVGVRYPPVSPPDLHGLMAQIPNCASEWRNTARQGVYWERPSVWGIPGSTE